MLFLFVKKLFLCAIVSKLTDSLKFSIFTLNIIIVLKLKSESRQNEDLHPITDRLEAKMLLRFHQEKNLLYDEAVY